MKYKKYIIILIVLFILIILLKDPYSIEDKAFISPNINHIMGTDDLGRDIYSRLFYGTINSLAIVLFSIGICTIIGNLIGLLCGYYGGLIDFIIQRIIEIILSIPSILIAVSISIIINKPLISLLLTLFLIYLPLIVNYSRGLIIKEKNLDYITANKTYGVSNFRIIVRHILPNINQYLVINFGINFSKGILTEAGLGFLGIGLEPSIPTLGNMLNASQSYFIKAPWFTIFPGLVIIIIVYYIRKKSSRKVGK